MEQRSQQGSRTGGRTVEDECLVVASVQPWNSGMAEELGRRTGRPVRHVVSRQELTSSLLERLRPRWVFVPHWSWLIPAEIYERFDVVIFHMTDLPYGRGGSPLQNLIARGHERTRISAIRCVEEMDAGPVYLKRDLPLHGSAEEVFLRASRTIMEMMVELVEHEPEPTPQRGDIVTFQRRRPEDGDLSVADSLDDAYDLIRMLDAEGYPHAYLDIGSLRLRFRRVARRSDGLHADVHITERTDTA